MKHPITQIGAPENQIGFPHAVITLVFQWQIKATPGNTDEVTCLAFRTSSRNQDAGPRPPALGRKPFFGTTSPLLLSTGLDPQQSASATYSLMGGL